MDYLKIKEALLNRKQPENKVTVYIKYLKQLETQKDKDGKIEAWWYAKNMTNQIATDLYLKVAIDGLFIDGDTITIGYKKRIILTYNYQAYKNKVLITYPETTFDLQLIYEGDSYYFKKKNGIILYEHDMVNQFKANRVIEGIYCIIINSRGQFVEFLEKTEIEKMKAVATMKHIWNNWEGEMWKKSVIKRACKTHFYDITSNMDKLDNEDNYDFENIEAPESIHETIKAFETKKELLDWASSKVNIPYQTDKEFRAAVKAKILELDQDADPAITE